MVFELRIPDFRFMKTFLSALLFLWISLPAKAQPPTKQAEKEIRSVLQAQAAAWNRGDLEGYMRAGYAMDDFLLFLGKSGATYGFDSTLARYRRGYKNAAEMGKLHFDILRIQLLSKDAAYVAGKWFLQKEKPSQGAFLIILQKGKKGWRIVADHSS